MSGAKGKSAWIIMSAVEGLKDQGFARWNYTIKHVNQHVKNNIRSYCQTKKLSSSSTSIISKKLNKSEESLRTVMYLSCWGPN
ncbi:hypothetical protein RND81_09G029300 [Saponaria officinalis]|uniref:Wound-responsive family protein n=1 Tax=Saponaria officinalis TaxID=3572 RepID=A0AAW1IHB9_SAPOF